MGRPWRQHPEELLDSEHRAGKEALAKAVIEDYRLNGKPLDPEHPPETIRLSYVVKHLIREMFGREGGPLQEKKGERDSEGSSASSS